MVDQQIRRRGVVHEGVLRAMEQVPRERFIDPAYASQAHDDNPLPIGGGQTISQPYMVARMTELCAPLPTDRALEVGAGSGYQTAVLASLCDHVYAMEYVEELARCCGDTLRLLGYENVTVSKGDGSLGWPEHGPYDIILVAAAAPQIPQPLQAQLADGGRLIIPVGSRDIQTLKCITRHGDDFLQRDDTHCRFVSLLGEWGWP